MSVETVAALLWRRVNDAAVQSLAGKSNGQYDIRLPARAGYEKFFAEVPRMDPTALGGFTLEVPIHALDGDPSVPLQNLKIRYMGAESSRRDWNIPSQRPLTAYPLWRLNRGLPTKFDNVSSEENYIILAKDMNGEFHARWLDPSAVMKLPDRLRVALRSEECGVVELNDKSAANPSDIADLVTRRLEKSYNVLLYGPPGTGKTHVMQEVMRRISATSVSIDTTSEHDALSARLPSNFKIGWVTFHQSYSYEEFVVGLRPEPGSSSLINLVARPGILLELAAFAAQPGNSALLIIDELNRGNTSRIFGEFITLLEADKRLDSEGKDTELTVAIRLPYLPRADKIEIEVDSKKLSISNPFKMPRCLYTLASMNSVDKSVAPLDAALRRRFDVVPLVPDIFRMASVLGLDDSVLATPLTKIESALDVKRLALQLLHRLNDGIAFLIGQDYAFGHWYLSGLNREFSSSLQAMEAFIDIWDFRLLPQLQELFHERTDQLIALLRLEDSSVPSPTPLIVRRSLAGMTDLGGDAFLEHPRVAISIGELQQFFLNLLAADPSA